MTVRVRQRKTKGGAAHWQADIHVRLPDGTVHRERRKVSARSERGALRWAREREAFLIRYGIAGARRVVLAPTPARVPEVPTFAEFARRYVEEHAKANRLKPSTVAQLEADLRCHLVPLLGHARLDQIGELQVQTLKRKPLAASTINKILSTLRSVLNCAVRWGVLTRSPVRIRAVRQQVRRLRFYDFDDFQRLVEAAGEQDPRVLVAVLLGGEAGLRSGEIVALEWSAVDLERGALMVSASEWHGHVDAPKSGRVRQLPLTRRLRAALAALERRGSRVLYRDNGRTVDKNVLRRWLGKAQRQAGLKEEGIHILRHTFCSHLAMRGAPPRAIQALAGHAKSSTTDLYMHLTPRALESAVSLLDGPEDSDG